MKKVKLGLSALTIVLILFTGCTKETTENTATTNKSTETIVATQTAKKTTETKYGTYDEEDFDESYDEKTATKIELNDSSSKIEGSGASEKDNVISITTGGTYILSGSYNGQIKVSAANETVHLILNNTSITNTSSSAIYVEQAKKVITTLAEGSKNSLTDGAEYVFGSADETEPDAVFFSKDDLTINGTGTLDVTGKYSNGIRSKDDLVITNGIINVTTKNNGIKGKDSVSIADGTFNLNTTAGDGIQANNSTDPDKGWIAIDGGTFTIQSGNDGIQAETNLSIAKAKIKLQTADGYKDQTLDTTASYKGLKASGNIVIDDGTFDLNTADDAIHSNAAVTINKGAFSIASGDDGIHADSDLLINNGTITVNNSYEGLEGATVTINDGDISVYATDDGINAAGGSSGESEHEGQFGADSFGEPGGGQPGGGGDSTKFIEINGGTTYVNADGDGIDSNGDIRMAAGTLIVNGPTDDGNAALDYDGTFTISGGIFVASGSSGMAMSASDSSSQAALSLYFDETQKAETLINLKNASGKTILSVAPTKDFSHIAISSPDLKVGETITLSSGGNDSSTAKNGLYSDSNYSNGTELAKIAIDDVLTSVDQSGTQVDGSQMGGGPGGQPPR
ncbi:carbohydrate-binding domain-containing protein [Candidatus Enterococcus ikei]|uniref:Carbohydrate-binding domain-containing protein n=1 Tax=Candidatus Enterococcus ikei TaxID=2815326 RepID=A0ABS3H190_9ENTE|nr:carbohydrate-binding domain-containing protein [Enterococcus sp. DIV0869a]MBO0441296.1 carbohydrate-binding domain-containing protein [Enterococcus sp. DIV0869a]